MCTLLWAFPCAVLFQVYRTAPFTSAVNNGDAAPATGSEEDRERRATTGDGPVSRAAEKAADVFGKARGAAEEVKEAGRARRQGPGQEGRRGRQGECQGDAVARPRARLAKVGLLRILAVKVTDALLVCCSSCEYVINPQPVNSAPCLAKPCLL